jgi:xanthine dehydrogenase YagT iron-sulfur-binding subunit
MNNDDRRPFCHDGVALTRREVVIGAAATPLAAALLGTSAAQQSARAAQDASTVATRLVVNGASRNLDLDPRSSLLDVLREQLGLTGAKKGCDHGQCGACTVHIEGQRVVSCLTPAVQADSRSVTTIEGIASADGGLHPMQQAFIDHDALHAAIARPAKSWPPSPACGRDMPRRARRSANI